MAQFGGKGACVGGVVWFSIGVATVLSVTAHPCRAQRRTGDARIKAARPTETQQSLNEILEGQRSLSVSLSELRDRIDELRNSLADSRAEVRQNHDTVQGAIEQLKGMREEVRGLYVESSGLKGDIAQVGQQVENLGASLASFRLSAGIVVAVVVVLQIALVGLMLRGRG